MPKKAGNRGNTDKRGSHRAAFDQAAALEALAWAQGGTQLALPGLAVQRFVGVAPLADDAKAGEPGRPPGARNLVPQAFREYLVARYGSAIEGLAQDATRPVVAIVAELAQAYIAACQALGLTVTDPTPAQIFGWVEFAKGLQLQARRYVAPYQHTQAPQPVAGAAVVNRIGFAMFTQGQPSPGAAESAKATLAELLEIQPLSAGQAGELDAGELDAGEGDDG